ncbi:MAG: hypothetical protein FH762_20045 [Firmicutes bacterium]|nr:hypothetical protein [Bacillota bacterium]
MNIERELNKLTNMVNGMSDEEFLNTLKKAGLENCKTRVEKRITYRITHDKDRISLEDFFGFDNYDTCKKISASQKTKDQEKGYTIIKYSSNDNCKDFLFSEVA